MSGLQWNAAGFSQYSPYAVSVANQYGIPVNDFLNQLSQESEWNVNAVSPVGAYGIAQIMPGTASSPGYGVSPVDPSDPLASINFMGQYDAAMYSRTGNWNDALAAYNAGLGDIQAGQSYASAITGGAWNSYFGNTTSSLTQGAPAAQPSTDALTEWFTNPGQAFSNAITGAGAVESAITGQPVYNQGQTIQPGAAQNAIASSTGINLSGVQSALASIGNAFTGFNSTLSAATSKQTWTDIAIGGLGVILVVGALIWLAMQSRTVQQVVTTAAAAA